MRVWGLALSPVLPEISQSLGEPTIQKVPGGPAKYRVTCEGIEVGLGSVKCLSVLPDWGKPFPSVEEDRGLFRGHGNSGK